MCAQCFICFGMAGEILCLKIFSLGARIQLVGNLDLGAAWDQTAKGCVLPGGSLDAILFPQFTPQEHG